MTITKNSIEFSSRVKILCIEAMKANDNKQIEICNRFSDGNTWLYDSCTDERIGVPECGLVEYLDALIECIDKGSVDYPVKYIGSIVYASFKNTRYGL